MTIYGLVPLELERLTDSEGRNDIGNSVSDAQPDNNPCDDAHTALSKDPKVQGQDGKLWEQACCHVDELGRRL